ncbi:MAG TPA: thioesterase family protein [Longimicrobium sp.]|nr:thioesterase family protein [Longimicrobium sp.]
MTSLPSCSVEFRARYAETDQMGVVYHANYLPWCEIGRTDLIRRVWRPYAELEAEGVMLAVTEVNLRYHASARYDDLIRVVTTVAQARSRGVVFEYQILRVEKDGSTTRLVSARTDLISIDRSGAPVRLPPEVFEAFRNGRPSTDTTELSG